MAKLVGQLSTNPGGDGSTPASSRLLATFQSVPGQDTEPLTEAACSQVSIIITPLCYLCRSHNGRLSRWICHISLSQHKSD